MEVNLTIPPQSIVNEYDFGVLIVKVKEVLGKKPTKIITITAEKSLQQASDLLTEYNIGAIVVVDNDSLPVGILSERDIVRKIAEHQAEALNLTVKDAMTADIITGVLDEDLNEVSSTMTNNRIRHLPILDGKQLVGMVSIGDVVKTQLDHAEFEAKSLRQYITGGYE